MQLDIFDNSGDVMLRNDALDAVLGGDAVSARAAAQRLADAFPSDPSLPALAVLIDALTAGPDPFTDHAAAHDARRHLDERVAPAARGLLGTAAGAWLGERWRETARRAAALTFRAERCDEHAAALWLRAADASAAADAAARIESWRRIPAPLCWMAEARCRLDGLDAAWPLLAELAWLAPQRFDAVARRLADPLLDRLRKRFDAAFEGDGSADDQAWFPAWLLTEKPSLAVRLSATRVSRDTPPEQALRVLLQLLVLERQGRHQELVERRKALRDISPQLYGEYIRTR